MKILLLVIHAPSSNMRRMQEAAFAGAKSANIMVRLLSPFEAQPIDVKQSNAILLGTPENLGYMSGALKDFFDRIYYPCLEETQGKPYACFIRAGHDGTGTKRAIEAITTGLKWRQVQPPLICRGEFEESFITACYDLGAAMGLGLEAGVF